MIEKDSNSSKTIQNIQTSQKRDEAIDKLEEAGIPIDDDVLDAVRSHHISQVLKAIAIIKEKDCISYPKGYFLKIVGQQPKENLGSLHKEYRANIQQGYTLEYLKWLYPNNWREAAVHFGIVIEGEDND